jgi:hypothetical protein
MNLDKEFDKMMKELGYTKKTYMKKGLKVDYVEWVKE